ncbi:MAG: class I SAM-dependent methyltransferase, partial [Methylococcaceae bacterium]
MVSGFISYAPELALEGGGGFKSGFFRDLAALEDKNFWFRSRNNLIVWALGKYNPSFRSFLEIGCGTGYVLSGISKAFPDRKFFGSEIFTTGLSFAAERLTSAHLMQMDAREIPFVEELYVIGAFDVLEHIKEDDEVLVQVHQALKPG